MKSRNKTKSPRQLSTTVLLNNQDKPNRNSEISYVSLDISYELKPKRVVPVAKANRLKIVKIHDFNRK